MFLQNQNVSNRDGNRSIPVSDGHCLSSSAHRHTSTHSPAPDSESSFIHNEYESTFNREIGSPPAPPNGFVTAFGVHVPGTGPEPSTLNYEDVVTYSTNRSASQVQVPSSGFHQYLIPLPPLTAPSSYRNNETASPSRPIVLPSHRIGTPSLHSSPPPSYQEVMEGAYSEPPPAYQQAILHPAKRGSDSE